MDINNSIKNISCTEEYDEISNTVLNNSTMESNDRIICEDSTTVMNPSGKSRRWEQKLVQIKTMEGEFSVTMWASGISDDEYSGSDQIINETEFLIKGKDNKNSESLLNQGVYLHEAQEMHPQIIQDVKNRTEKNILNNSPSFVENTVLQVSNSSSSNLNLINETAALTIDNQRILKSENNNCQLISTSTSSSVPFLGVGLQERLQPNSLSTYNETLGNTLLLFNLNVYINTYLKRRNIWL